MKAIGKLLLLSAVFTYPSWLFAQIGAKVQQQQSLEGIWTNTEYGYQMVLILKEDGTGEFDGEAIQYSTSSTQLVLRQASQSTVYDYLLQGNTLKLSGGDIDGSIAFTRAGGRNQPEKAAAAGSSAGSSEIIGKWSLQGETIEFTQYGKCLYMNQSFDYQIKGDQVVLLTSQGNAVFSYAVKSEQLHLSANGQTLVYTKEGDSVANSSPGATTAKGAVAAELVGKWCYINVTSSSSGGSSSERCITLHPNGTYEYYGETSRSVNTDAFYGGTGSQSSDQGTWTYDGTKIYYTSAMGAGSGAYTLQKVNHPKNGDPMIVLDGEAYVTFYQKEAWR